MPFQLNALLHDYMMEQPYKTATLRFVKNYAIKIHTQIFMAQDTQQFILITLTDAIHSVHFLFSDNLINFRSLMADVFISMSTQQINFGFELS